MSSDVSEVEPPLEIMTGFDTIQSSVKITAKGNCDLETNSLPDNEQDDGDCVSFYPHESRSSPAQLPPSPEMDPTLSDDSATTDTATEDSASKTVSFENSLYVSNVHSLAEDSKAAIAVQSEEENKPSTRYGVDTATETLFPSDVGTSLVKDDVLRSEGIVNMNISKKENSEVVRALLESSNSRRKDSRCVQQSHQAGWVRRVLFIAAINYLVLNVWAYYLNMFAGTGEILDSFISRLGISSDPALVEGQMLATVTSRDEPAEYPGKNEEEVYDQKTEQTNNFGLLKNVDELGECITPNNDEAGSTDLQNIPPARRYDPKELSEKPIDTQHLIPRTAENSQAGHTLMDNSQSDGTSQQSGVPEMTKDIEGSLENSGITSTKDKPIVSTKNPAEPKKRNRWKLPFRWIRRNSRSSNP